jgi:hypothetical protein
MFRKSAVLIVLAVSFVMFSLSTLVFAEEAAQRNKEARVQELKERLQELEKGLGLAMEERNEDKAARLKKELQEVRKKLERLLAESREPQKPKGEFPEIQEGIQRTNGNLKELRQAIKALREEGGNPEKLKELQDKIGREERKLVELKGLLEKRRGEAKRKRERPRSKLMFFPLEHANAESLGKLIKNFLTPEGIIAADPATNILVVKDTPNGLEIASAIIENLDIPGRRAVRDRTTRDQPRRRQEQRERAEREDVFFGKVLEAGKQSLTIQTRDSGEKVTLYVPVRRRDDGTEAPNEELSAHVSSFEVGSNVRVQWRQVEGKHWIVRVSKIGR